MFCEIFFIIVLEEDLLMSPPIGPGMFGHMHLRVHQPPQESIHYTHQGQVVNECLGEGATAVDAWTMKWSGVPGGGLADRLRLAH